ncbi:MAG: peptidase MA family metallohydrolase [bacterium]
MPADPHFDLELLGFRNDLARERVLAFLRSLPEAAGIDRDTPLPLRLPLALLHDPGLRLLGALRERGAQVRLVASPGTDTVAAPLVPAPLEAPPPPRRGTVWPVVSVMLLGLAVGVLARYLPMPRPLPPRSPIAAQEPLPLDAHPASPSSHRLNDEAVGLNASGQFAAAATRLRAALADAPGELALQRNLRTVLQNWAVAELNAEHPDAAVPLLEEALGLASNAPGAEDAGVLSALGIARVRQGDWSAGKDTLERATALGAADAATFTSLAKAYRQLGDRAAAVDALHRARDSGAAGPDFEAMVSRLERELDAEWDFDEMRSAHFSIGFAAGERESREAAELIAHGLEDAYFHVGHKLDLYPADRIAAVLYPSEDFHDVTQTPSWSSGVFDGRIKLPVGGLAQGDPATLERTLRHEYGHVLVHQLSRGHTPVWLNEGIALWSEETRDGDRAAWATDTIAGQELFRLRELQEPFLALPAARVHIAYAQSYLAVKALIDRHGARRVREVLEQLGAGQPFDAAFQAAFYQTPDVFDAELVQQLTR